MKGRGITHPDNKEEQMWGKQPRRVHKSRKKGQNPRTCGMCQWRETPQNIGVWKWGTVGRVQTDTRVNMTWSTICISKWNIKTSLN